VALRPVFSLVALTLLVFALPACAQSNQPLAPQRDAIWQRDVLTDDWGEFRTHLEQAGMTYRLQEQSEVWANLTGGIRRGIAGDGLLTASLTGDLERMLGWVDAKFFASGFQIHGHGPTGSLVGNLQDVSNIEATNSAKLYDLWLEQRLLRDRLTIRLGQEGANDEMMIAQYDTVFLNSSFGFPGLLAADLPSGGPNYPLATPFVRAQFRPIPPITLVGAIYNGDPAPPGGGDPQLRDRHGTAFRANDDALGFAEIWYSPDPDGPAALPTTYKLGAWYDTGVFADRLLDQNGLSLANPTSLRIPRGHHGDYGAYGIIDQMLWRRPETKEQGVGVFLQIMGAPSDRNLSNLFIEGGVVWKGPSPARANDTAGLAATYLGISPVARLFSKELALVTGAVPYAAGELVLEATYAAQVAPWLSLQPDAQLVINPGAGVIIAGGRTSLPNALVIGLRATVTF